MKCMLNGAVLILLKPSEQITNLTRFCCIVLGQLDADWKKFRFHLFVITHHILVIIIWVI